MTPEERFRRNWARLERRDADERRIRRLFWWCLFAICAASYFLAAVMGHVYRAGVR